MVKDKNGKWITPISTSPENVYITDKGERGATAYGATGDLAMMRELLDQSIKSTEILEVDVEFRNQVKEVIENLHPYQIGKKGSLMEWYYDWDEAEPWHRHTTHLFGLFPGNHISPKQTPDLANACRKTLELRGDETTGWSMGWRINLYARLLDGEKAYNMFRKLLSFVPAHDDGTGRHHRGGTYPNLFDAHPPFQIDGNFGAVSGIIEMLVQYNNDYIEILPALPKQWAKQGSFKGIKVPGNITVDAEWSNDKINNYVSVTLSSPYRQTVKLKIDGKIKNVHLQPNKAINIGLGTQSH